MTKLIIVRTGHTDWNVINRIQGSLDIPLNERGVLSAKRVAYELKEVNIDCIFSSCLCRSYETASIIAQEHNMKLRKAKELNELDHGLWQGLTLAEIKKRYTKQYVSWKASPFSTKPPQGESVKEAYDRVVNFVQKIVDKNKNKQICIVAHEIVIALIKCHFQGLDVNDIWDIITDAGTWEIIDVG